MNIKGKREVVTMAREEAQRAKIIMKKSERAFDAQWSAKRCDKIGKSLHQAIKLNAPVRHGTSLRGVLLWIGSSVE